MNVVRFVSFLFRFVRFIKLLCLLACFHYIAVAVAVASCSCGRLLLAAVSFYTATTVVRSFVRSLLLLLVSVLLLPLLLLLLLLSLSLLTSLLRLVGQSGCEHYFVPVLFVLFRSVFVLFFLRSKMEIIYRHIITTTKQTKDLTVFSFNHFCLFSNYYLILYYIILSYIIMKPFYRIQQQILYYGMMLNQNYVHVLVIVK